MQEIIIEILLGGSIITYTGYIVYKRFKDLKAGKSCCGGNSSNSGCSSCASCASKGKCGMN
jgi:hypothetical protein